METKCNHHLDLLIIGRSIKWTRERVAQQIGNRDKYSPNISDYIDNYINIKWYGNYLQSDM